MSEVGIDIADRRPRKLLPEMQYHADWAVTLNCGDACPYVPGIVEDWDVPDAADRPLDEVRTIRDDIERRVIDLVQNRLQAIHDDRTAQRARLAKLLEPLVDEFGETKDAEVIRRCADQILERHADAPVRGFLQTIAYREARECLRSGACEQEPAVAKSV